MMAVRINDSSEPPAILIADRTNHFGARLDCTRKRPIRVVHDHHQTHRPTVQRFGAEIQMFWGLVRDPKFGSFHGQSCYHRTFIIIVAKRFSGAESRLVELDSLRPVSHRQHRRYRHFMLPYTLRLAAHETLSRVEPMVGFSGADQGCGCRASMNEKMVMSTASAANAPSRTIALIVSGSGVGKQPQLMFMCRREARVSTVRNPSMIRGTSAAQIRHRHPMSTSNPNPISVNATQS